MIYSLKMGEKRWVQMKKGKRLSAGEMARAGLFTAIICVCAFISVPAAVPFTLQLLAVFTAAGLLGVRGSFLAVFVYLLLGACGLPVFSGFRGGVGVLLGATGGFLFGFIPAALIVSCGVKSCGRSVPVLFCSMLAGLIACYAVGTAWFALVYSGGEDGLGAVLLSCVVPYIVPDLAKIAVSVYLTKRLERFSAK